MEWKRRKSKYRRVSGATTSLLVAGIAVVAFATLAVVTSDSKSDGRASDSQIDTGDDLNSRTAVKHSVHVHPGPPTPRTDLGVAGRDGKAVTVACGTCHANRRPNSENRTSADLDEFHQGMVLAHHDLSCLSCHHADDYESLRLADGTTVAYADVMTLCAQCHGTQHRDYVHGVHGGMSGHWDLNRGPRERNNCIDCHQAHAPQFPKMHPTFKPRDRFLDDASHGSNTHDE